MRQLEGQAVDEVDPQKQRESEDEDQDRGGPPVRAEPAFTFVQELANLREVAPMMDRLYRHCRQSHGGRWPPDRMPSQEPFGTHVARGRAMAVSHTPALPRSMKLAATETLYRHVG